MILRDALKRAGKWPVKLLVGRPVSHLPRDQFGMSDEEFLLAVLEEAPEGSRVWFDQCEPESWIPRLAKWAKRKEPSQLEADHYVLGPEFLGELRTILGETPDALWPIHHLGVITAEGESLLSSLDNFDVVELSEGMCQALLRRSGSA